MLRKIQEIRHFEGDEEEVLTQIETQKESSRESETLMNQRIVGLIRDNRIDSYTASSLINDIGFTRSISKKLLKCAVILWVRDDEIKELGDEYEYE